jgi:phthiocerol/phenolphthiocerol synthesis type-I polyketide synthase E
MSDESTGSEIALIGCVGRFPGAADVETFWRNLAAGVESITFFTPAELRASGIPETLVSDPAYVRARGTLPEADAFDAALFGMSPREARITNPQHRVFLECAWEALEDAGHDPARFSGLIGVFAGASMNRYLYDLYADPELTRGSDDFQLMVANDKDFLATRASYKLGLEGPAFTVQTACSTSLVAVHLACQSLLNGECDLALAGGVSVQWPQEAGYYWSEGMALSPDGHCRAFDANARGTVIGHGVGLVVLRRLEDALEAGDSIRAVIRGSAINNDGAQKVGYTAPRIEGQAKAIRAAQRVAEVDARSISYVEAHGTATPLGDPIEVAALTRAFRATTRDTGFCALGSVKTNIGHLDAAAGVAGLIKTVLALEHGQIPPSLGFEAPNPAIDFAASPFFVNAELRDWPAEEGEPRRAAVSSFGIGGTNAHVVLEEAPPREASGEAREHQLLVLSARTETALGAAAERLAAHLEGHPNLSLADAAFTLRRGRRELEHRRAVVCTDAAGAVAALRGRAPSRTASGHIGEGRAAAFLFPGLGPQHSGMAAGLLASEPVFRREMETCAEILRPLLGLDPLRLLRPPAGTGEEAAERLADIAVAMPVLFAVEQSLGRLWMSWGVTPKAMIGHSLGEYAAACLAGVFSTEDGARIMAARGRLLAEIPPGAMLSVPLGEEEATALLGGDLWLAIVNGPRNCILSGTPEAIDVLEARLTDAGKTCRRVRARGAYHSPMTAPILDRFAAELARVSFRAPSIPFLSNLTGTWIRVDQATDPGYWVDHLRSTVRFGDNLDELLRDPGIVPVEVGPGRTLATLAAERLGGGRPALVSLPHPREETPDTEVLALALGRVWAEGVPVDWKAYAADEERQRVPLPTYPFERRRYAPAPRGEAAAVETPAEAPADEILPDLADWFHVPVWRQTPPLEPVAEALRGPWLFFVSGIGPGEALARRLEERGEAVARVERGDGFRRLDQGRYALHPERPEGYDALLAALAEEGLAPVGVVHGWSVGGESDSFHPLLALAQATGRRGMAPLRLTVLSDGLHRIAGEAGGAPEKATLLGPVLVIPREMPGAVCRSVDVTVPAAGSPEEEDLVEALLAELGAAEPPLVALRDGSRWVGGFEALRLEAPAEPLARLREGGAYLITGGLGAMGLAFAERFAQKTRVKLALLSRSGLPEGTKGDPRAARIRRIEALGSEVLVLRADVTDAEAMALAVETVRERFGPIRGAIHAAGILGTGLLQRKTREAADAVLAPKVRGTLILDHLLRGEPLDFFVLCSSLSAFGGGLGQVDYGAANAFLDAFAHWRGRPVTAIDWDRWKGEGMAWAAAGGTAAPEVHPLLGACVHRGPQRSVFASRLGPGNCWVLDEHRLLDRPLLPGTAYLEMARAACESLAGPGPVEMTDILFWTPLLVPPGREAEVWTVLDHRGDGFAFQVVSAVDGPSGERRLRRHASGTVRPLEAAAAEAVRVRTAAIPERFPALDALPAEAPGPDSFVAQCGPRWQCLRRSRFAEDEGLADLVLDQALAGDLTTWRLHPALFDAATSFAGSGLSEGFHLPLSYRAVRVLAPLGAEVRSWARRRASGSGTFTVDLVVTAPDGTPLVEVEEFTKRRVDPGQGEADLAAAESEQAGVRDRSLLHPAEIPEIAAGDGGPGMWPSQGAEALVRILARRTLPQVAVSTRSLSETRPARRPAAGARRREEATDPQRPQRSQRSAIPGNGSLEETLRRLWSEVLGLSEVGVDDNFFALGGDSILGLQIVARAREEGLELAPGQIFEHQTIAELAALLSGQPVEAEPSVTAVETAPPAPGDFPLAQLDADNLDRIFAQISALDEEEQ